MRCVSALINRMFDKNMFLSGAVDLKEGSVTEKIKELRAKDNAHILLFGVENKFAESPKFSERNINPERRLIWLSVVEIIKTIEATQS